MAVIIAQLLLLGVLMYFGIRMKTYTELRSKRIGDLGPRSSTGRGSERVSLLDRMVAEGRNSHRLLFRTGDALVDRERGRALGAALGVMACFIAVVITSGGPSAPIPMWPMSAAIAVVGLWAVVRAVARKDYLVAGAAALGIAAAALLALLSLYP